MKILLYIFAFLIACSSSWAQNLSIKYGAERILNNSNQAFTVFVKGNKDQIKAYCDTHSIPVKQVNAGYFKLTIRPQQLIELNNIEGVNYIDYSFTKGRLLNDSSRVINNVEPIHQGHSDLISSFTGKDVLIGVIDGGLDCYHPDFLDSDGKTRVLKYWKQAQSYSATLTPAKFGYGREYDSTYINNNTLNNGGNQAVDHGTTVTGTAAGNANANGDHKGMAPDANLVIVSSNFNNPNWKASVADAVEYIIDVADSVNMPVIINASIGDYYGSHDGQDAAALYIDSLLNAKTGRLMVCAGGNSGELGKYHLHTPVSMDTSFTWFNYNPSTALGYGGAYMELWGDTLDMQQLSLSIALDTVDTSNHIYERRGTMPHYTIAQLLASTVNDSVMNDQGDVMAYVELSAFLRGGQYNVQIAIPDPDSIDYKIALLSEGSGSFDLWSADWLGLNTMETYVPDSADFPRIVNYVLPDSMSTIVDSWACSPSVITTANFFSRLSYTSYAGNPITINGTPGAKAPSSSLGPSRTALMKPDIGATGDLQMSAGSLATLTWHQTNDPDKLDNGGMHIRNGGTSMASPVVCGIGALLLEKCPQITTSDFVQAIHDGAKSDGFTGTLPNFAFGYGKVDGLATLVSTNPSIQITGDPVFCEGDSTELSSTFFDTLQWHNAYTGTSQYFDSTQLAYVNVTDNRGCKAVSDTINVYESPFPPTPTATQVANGLTSSPGFTYQWYQNGLPMTGENGQQLIISSAGYYQVEVSNQYGCTSISDWIWYSPTGISENKPDIQIQPNPFSDELFIQLEAGMTYDLVDLSGRHLLSGNHYNTTLETSQLARGSYYLIVKKDGNMWTYPLIKH